MDKTLLSVDWDYFFPIPEHDPHALYDWGHREDREMFYSMLWTIRAADFLRMGYNELPGTSGEEKDFWSRFTLKQDAMLYYAESHAVIRPVVRQVLKGVTKILSFDAHHDAGYERLEPIGCDNWVAHLAKRIKVRVVYPVWKFYAFEHDAEPLVPVLRVIDDGEPIPEEIDAVFVCRSGAWTPGWLDDDFDEFLKQCPLKHRVQIGPMIERKWDGETPRKMANDMKAFFEVETKAFAKEDV